MENENSIIMDRYEGALFTNDPQKVVTILNSILKKPESALILEPDNVAYWIFYSGGINTPDISLGIEHYISDERVKTADENVQFETTNQEWIVQSILVTEMFFFEVLEILNRIKRKRTIKVLKEVKGSSIVMHFYYLNN